MTCNSFALVNKRGCVCVIVLLGNKKDRTRRQRVNKGHVCER